MDTSKLKKALDIVIQEMWDDYDYVCCDNGDDAEDLKETKKLEKYTKTIYDELEKLENENRLLKRENNKLKKKLGGEK